MSVLQATCMARLRCSGSRRLRNGCAEVDGCSLPRNLGCFRVLTFRTDPDDKRVATGGDGWLLAIEFGDVPRAYSVLAYGESPREDSPYHSDQAEMFARSELKRVAFTENHVEAQAFPASAPGSSVDPDRP